MNAYPIEFRKLVLADHDSGMSDAAIARKFKISTRWIYNLRKQREETGDITPRRGKTGPKRKLANHTDRLLQLVAENPDTTLDELVEKLDVDVGRSTVWQTLKRLGLTFKKSPACGGARSA